MQHLIEPIRATLRKHFPENAKRTCFLDHPGSVDDVCFDERLPLPIRIRIRRHQARVYENQHPHFRMCLQAHPDRPEEAFEGHVSLIRVDEAHFEKMHDWKSLAGLSLLVRFALWHETAHEILTLFRPDPKPEGGLQFALSAFTRDPKDEIFADLLAAMMLLKESGADALPFLKTIADIRLKGGLRSEDGLHFTTPALDSLIATYESGVDLPPIKKLPLLAFRMSEAPEFNYETLFKLRRDWVQALRSQDDLGAPSLDRLMLAVERTFHADQDERRAYCEKYELERHERAIDFMIHFGFPALDPGASARIFDFITQGTPINSNTSPGLGTHVRRKLSGISDRFLWVSAAQDPNFLHGLIESYDARRAFETIKRAFEMREAKAPAGMRPR